MTASSEVYDQLNKAWKATCKAVLGDEVGELKDCNEWLHEEYDEKARIEESEISGKPVTFTANEYCNDAKFISFDEIDFSKKFEPLNINEIKDIDSIVEAVQERCYYAGNVLLGTSKFVEGSSGITNSAYVYHANVVDESQYVADSTYTRQSKFTFGTWGGNFSSYLIKNWMVTKCQRCFQSCTIRFSSDLFYSANMDGCNDCFFSFNLNGKRRHIGNLEIPQDKYIELKKKLLSEIVDDLKRKKPVDSLVEMMSKFSRDATDINVAPAEASFNLAPVEEAFRKTFNILLKKDPRGLEQFKDYLLSKIPEIIVLTPNETSSHHNLVLMKSYRPLFKIKHRAISLPEAAVFSNSPKTLTKDETEKISLHAPEPLAKIAFIPVDYAAGKNQNISKVDFCMNASDCYYGVSYIEARSSAYCFWPRESSHAFGSSVLLHSSFCIGSHYSTNVTRAFEVDGCNNCSDIYFGHNCDNVHDSMFCFNVKNKTRAIGNAELPQEQYKSTKDALTEQIADELIKKKDFKWNIYNIGCGGRKA
jgi:hypothetical protein